MGRPRANAEELSATEKIESAFWKVLEKEGFENVTILRLTQETGLNRNSIYYHYQNVEDVAEKTIEHNMRNKDVNDFIDALFSINNSHAFDPKLLLHIKRIHLLAESKSPFLQSFLKTKMINTWLEYFNIDSNKISDTDLVQIEFISSGIISIIGSGAFIDNPNLINAFPTSFIGKAAIQTLQSLSEKTSYK